ncbi:MAG: hypothetical protein VX497_00865 [Candidatus Neomarinimicrobiota bacterium]|nr:hypothetical protein [Candidatus Neomarinimicrobiota bacterium]
MYQTSSKLILIIALSTLNAQITKESFIGEWNVDKESYLIHLEKQMGGQKINLDDPKLKKSRMYSMIVGMVEMADHFSFVFTKDSAFVKVGPGDPIPSGNWEINGSEIHLIGDRKSFEERMGKKISLFTEDEIKEMLITKLLFKRISDSIMEFDYEEKGRPLKFNKK